MALIRTMCALIGAMCAGAVLPSTAAAAWPERPITLLHGFGAGGNGDLTARVVAERLSARLGQSVVVEPKPGARLEPQEVIDWVAERIARYKKPKQVWIVERLPRKSDGTVDREAAKKLVADRGQRSDESH